MEATSPEAQAELVRRQKAAATTILGLFVATILLSVVAFLGRPFFTKQENQPLDMAVRIVLLVLGLGAVVWRRNKLSSMRLRDIVGINGVSGLLRTLEKTTIQVGLIGAAVAAIGFIATLITGNERYTYGAGTIALIIFISCYPIKSSWLRTLYRFTEAPPEVE